MLSDMIIEACDFCTSFIKLNILAISNPDKANEEKEKLLKNIKQQHIEFSFLHDSEVKALLSDIYEKNIDNDKYGRTI